jgi:DNA adenine methylase
LSNTKTYPSPFVKWAGGKRQLLDEISRRLPKTYNAYYEPFVGGGALLFNLAPNNASINDINTSLINAYLCIKEYPEEVIEEISGLDAQLGNDPKVFYYKQRDEFNKMLAANEQSVRSAATLIFINKHCFNGLYRVNAKGQFNVPYNGSKASSCHPENIYAASAYLSNVSITNEDFEGICDKAKAGDFVFLDSPYAPLNPTSFEAYTKEGFSHEDHVRLAETFRRLTSRGCYCMLTNHNTDFINELYGDFSIDVVRVKRAINSDATKRTGTEVIIRNY